MQTFPTLNKHVIVFFSFCSSFNLIECIVSNMLVLNRLIFAIESCPLSEYIRLEVLINFLLINSSVHRFPVFSLRIIVLVKHKSV